MENENTNNCTHDCSTCKLDCKSRSLKVEPNKLSKVKHVIGIVSGKGGVGKSMVCSILASAMQKRGLNSAILDADILGPSIPKMFGVSAMPIGTEDGVFPAFSKKGTQIVSTNLLLEHETEPVVWRGPVLAGMVTQFWQEFIWNDVDYMFVDMPPGTGDVPLTVFQSLPVEGIIIVTTPQDLVSMIVEKAVNMSKIVNVPILGIVENMSYFICPDCKNKHYIFGKSNIEDFAKRYNISTYTKLPINPDLSALSDIGQIEDADVPEIENIVEKLLNI